MKTNIIFSIVLTFLSSPSYAFSTRECRSINNTKYSSNDYIGGAHPYPGMITNIEEIKIKDNVVYRIVRREACRQEECNPEQPDLIDIIPENFNFNFIQESKRIIDTEGTNNSPIYRETYIIKFHLSKNFWMLCHHQRELRP